MSTKRMKLIARAVALCVLYSLLSVVAVATAQSAPSDSQPTSTSTKPKSAKSDSAPSSASEIEAAKASHKVWVNLATGVYHKRGRWYGKTKNGKFMTEEEARKAGYRAAKRE